VERAEVIGVIGNLKKTMVRVQDFEMWITFGKVVGENNFVAFLGLLSVILMSLSSFPNWHETRFPNRVLLGERTNFVEKEIEE
jgi:hypothetical protein